MNFITVFAALICLVDGTASISETMAKLHSAYRRDRIGRAQVLDNKGGGAEMAELRSVMIDYRTAMNVVNGAARESPSTTSVHMWRTVSKSMTPIWQDVLAHPVKFISQMTDIIKIVSDAEDLAREVRSMMIISPEIYAEASAILAYLEESEIIYRIERAEMEEFLRSVTVEKLT